MQIGHEVHDANQNAEADGHWEVDNRETDAEQDAHRQGDEALSADVVVEFAFDVAHQFAPERA